MITESLVVVALISHLFLHLWLFPFKTFTRLAEQVLAANKKDLDLLRISLDDELNLTALEEEEGLCDSRASEQRKGCWC